MPEPIPPDEKILGLVGIILSILGLAPMWYGIYVGMPVVVFALFIVLVAFSER